MATLRGGLVVDTFKLILVPLWIAHYSDRERRYDAVVNGQTGNVRGERPRGRWSKWVGWILGDD